MSAHGAVQGRRWADLPGDLLSDIYLRSVSMYERARFAAVCSPWRAVASWHPRLPALPLLLLSTGDGNRDREARVYSPEDGRVLRVPLPWFPWGNRLVGTYDGGWIATVSGSGGLLVVNMFSGARAARLYISNLSFIWKIVFSKDPSSGGCIMAAMTSRGIALRKLGCPGSGWTTSWSNLGLYGDLVDIAFCNGELLGVTPRVLIVFNVGLDKEGVPRTILDFPIDVAMRALHAVELWSTVKYILDLHGKLAIVVEVEPTECDSNKGHFFRVFGLAKNEDTTTSHQDYAWMEMISLGDYALFLGPAGCCKAVHVLTGCRRGEVERNRIYFSKEHTYLHNSTECLARLDMGSCTVHCWESEGTHHLERIVSQGYHYHRDHYGANGCNGCVWLWPPDF